MELDESLQRLLQLEQWDRFSLAECEAVARQLENFASPIPFPSG